MIRHVPLVDGKPMCPEGCGQPMEETAPNVWRCSEWGPVWDALFERVVPMLAAAMDDAVFGEEKR